MCESRSHDAVIRFYDDAGNVIRNARARGLFKDLLISRHPSMGFVQFRRAPQNEITRVFNPLVLQALKDRHSQSKIASLRDESPRLCVG